jgi:S-adenosylmethionine synthetase
VGREPQWVEKTFRNRYESEPTVRRVELFTWEKLDMVDQIRSRFAINS